MVIKHQITYICDGCNKEIIANKKEKYFTFEICIQHNNEDNTSIVYQEDYNHQFCSLDCLHNYLITIVPNYKSELEYNENKRILELYKQQNR